jgi:hypothetical protein
MPTAPAGKPFILSGAGAFDEGPCGLRQCDCALHPQRGLALTTTRGDDMSRKQKQLVRKPSKKIADARRVRYGASWAPRKVRFGASWSPAILRK